jgi:hypothetical protein
LKPCSRVRNRLTGGCFLDDPQLFLDALHVRLVDQRRVRQGELALLRLFGQDVAFESVLPFDFTRACHFKAFLGAGFGFHFRHFPNYLITAYYFCFSSRRSKQFAALG